MFTSMLVPLVVVLLSGSSFELWSEVGPKRRQDKPRRRPNKPRWRQDGPSWAPDRHLEATWGAILAILKGLASGGLPAAMLISDS